MKYISTSAVALSLLMAASPLAAFADKGADDANVNVTVSSEVEVNHTDKNNEPGKNIGEGLRGFFTGPMLKMRADDSKNHPEDRTGTSSPKHTENNDDKGGLKAKVGSDAGIDARIVKLNDVLVRLNGVQRLSAEAKASLIAAINAQLSALNALKVQVQAQATTTVKDDMNTTKDSFRAYSLLLPKAAIMAAGDRIMTIVGQMEALSVKIDARIDTAAAAGADVTAARTALTDFKAKVADAKVQAQAAVSLVANLSISKDDDQATVTANAAVLKDAKAKIDAAQADLKEARKDVSTILKSIKGKGEVKADASASVR